MMINDRLFKTIPSLLPRDFRSLEDYLEDLAQEAEERDEASKDEEEQDPELKELYWN